MSAHAITQIGPYRVHAVLDGQFGLDGGAMFGVVPKPMWECHRPADGSNRVTLALRCLLLVDSTGGRVVLVDTGMGSRWSDKERAQYALDQAQHDLVSSLADVGVTPDDVTDILVTHLHFDHAGGLCRQDEDGHSVPAFDNAVLHVQATNWDWANNPTPRDRVSYRADDFAPYEAAQRLNLLPGDTAVLPGIRVEAGVGHTTGHQLVWVTDSTTELVFAGDLVPTSAHLSPAWGMGYDLRPLECMQEKVALLSRLVERGAALVFDHDPDLAATTIVRDGRRFVPGDPIRFGS